MPTTHFASSSPEATAVRGRARTRVHGNVQGVGFRPYVYRLARELDLVGWVLNDAHGVLLEIEGAPERIDEFLCRLPVEAPPLAVVERVESSALAPQGERTFAIRESPSGEAADAAITPDTAICADCLRELMDTDDRRYRYPFINCTNCGPRFTIVRGVPYDRALTTMAGFQMCPACLAEFEDPADRRFHAQPNACPRCGPAVRLIDPHAPNASVAPVAGDQILTAAIALREGAIIAVKGVGGFHLACRGDNETAVSTLRARKHREDKPLALMVRSVDEATALVELCDAARMLLCSPQRPIVLAARHERAGAVAESVAPHAPELGVMLPYSPLHQLLLADAGGSLVMTSGNVSEEPIAYSDEDAITRLAGIADLMLLHDRSIETRTDDSVLRTVDAAQADGSTCPRPMFMRRSRGYVPAGIAMPGPVTRPILACGAELKSTFCLVKGSRAWVSHHIGDLQNYETLRSFTDGVEHFKRLFAVEPEIIVHDLHPDYLSTKYALELDFEPDGTAGGRRELQYVSVQHHHAHMAACLAEHRHLGTAVGAIFDGSGYGSDGTIWGGELLVGDIASVRSAGALRQVRLPGGEQAVREPWRMACAWLTCMHGPEPPMPVALRAAVDARRWRLVSEMARTGLSSPLTSSIGRLFDAAAALCGIRTQINYEGQAAIEFEAACAKGEHGRYEVLVCGSEGSLMIDPVEALRSLVSDLDAGVDVGVVASRFHAGIAAATIAACRFAAAGADTETVVLSGGVFQNRRLLETTDAGLKAAGLRVLVPERLPPGDGGISYGQAAVAARRLGP